MTYSASLSGAPPPPPATTTSSSERGPAVVVQSTRPRPFQLARAVIWNPPAASGGASSSLTGPAPTSAFKTQAPAISSSSAHPAPLLHSLLDIARSAAPSAAATATATATAAPTPTPTPTLGWQNAPSHRFPPASYDQQQQQPFQSRPLSATGTGVAPLGVSGLARFAAPTGAASISGCENADGQTGQRHTSPAAPAPRSGIQERTGTSSSHSVPGSSSGARGGGTAAAATSAPTPASAPSTSSTASSSSGAAGHPLQHQPLRRGKWTKAEEEFAAATIRYFCSGLLNLQFGTLLRGFLAQQLHCHPMRISKKLLPGTTFCGVEISRKLGRRAYSPRWCDSPDATQQKLDAEAHLAQLREAFIASVEEETAAAAGDDTVMTEAKSGESVAAPTKSAAKARRSAAAASAARDKEDEEAEEKEAEDLYSRVSNVTMESVTGLPHSDGTQVESRAGSPAYFQPPPHHRVFQQLQPQPSYHLQHQQQQQQRHGFQHDSFHDQQQQQQQQQQLPYDGRKRSRDELNTVEQVPRLYHNLPQPHAAPFSSRLSYRGAEEAHSRSFTAPQREWQPFQQAPAAQHQPPTVPHAAQPSFAPSYYRKEDTIMGSGPNVPYTLQHPYQGPSGSGFPARGGKGGSPKQAKLGPSLQRPAQGMVPLEHHYYERSGYAPSYYGDEEETIMGGGANLPRVPFMCAQPYDEHSGNARPSVGSGAGGSAGGELKTPMLPKLPSLRASLQRASTSTYHPEQQQHQQRMNL